MPMSHEAAAGLRAAVEWNPYAARYLMDILRDLPIGVRYKAQDRYGPLGMMLNAVQPQRWITKEVSIPIRQERFPEDKLAACEIFHAEWLQHRFSKQELADAIEAILVEIEQPPLLEDVKSNTYLVFTANGTFLHDPDERSGGLKAI